MLVKSKTKSYKIASYSVIYSQIYIDAETNQKKNKKENAVWLRETNPSYQSHM